MASLFPAFGHLQNQSLRATPPPPPPHLHQVGPLFYADEFALEFYLLFAKMTFLLLEFANMTLIFFCFGICLLMYMLHVISSFISERNISIKIIKQICY